MLVTFSTKSYSNIMMFDDIATRLLHMMGNSAAIPGAIVADDVPEALQKLKGALNIQEGRPQAASDTAMKNRNTSSACATAHCRWSNCWRTPPKKATT